MLRWGFDLREAQGDTVKEEAASAISKTEAARRQIDTAIDLWFEERDELSVFTLAFASLKVLFSAYARASSDGFDRTLDKLIGDRRWRSMSGTANFLKHADRDPDAVLSKYHPDMGIPVIGLATLLYRRLTGTLSLKMHAFDSWTEMTAAEELGITEMDQNAERAQANKRVRDALKMASREAYMRFAHQYYEFFLHNRDRLEEEVNQALTGGASLQDVLDQKFGALRSTE
jgi:hypothetical protein